MKSDYRELEKYVKAKLNRANTLKEVAEQRILNRFANFGVRTLNKHWTLGLTSRSVERNAKSPRTFHSVDLRFPAKGMPGSVGMS